MAHGQSGHSPQMMVADMCERIASGAVSTGRRCKTKQTNQTRDAPKPNGAKLEFLFFYADVHRKLTKCCLFVWWKWIGTCGGV